METSDLSAEQLEVVHFSESLYSILLEVSIQFSKCLSTIEGPTVLSMRERCLFGHQST